MLRHKLHNLNIDFSFNCIYFQGTSIPVDGFWNPVFSCCNNFVLSLDDNVTKYVHHFESVLINFESLVLFLTTPLVYQIDFTV